MRETREIRGRRFKFPANHELRHRAILTKSDGSREGYTVVTIGMEGAPPRRRGCRTEGTPDG